MAFNKPELITEVISLSLMNANGAAMESFTVERGQGIHSGSYYVLFTPLSERFRFQLTGKTIHGKILRRVKPTEIQIREVQFDYGSVNYSGRIFPGITAKIPLKIKNVGISQNLTLKAMDDLGFIKSLVPNYVFVAENDTARFSLVMRAPANASAGETSTVTLHATATSSGKLSNYMVLYVSVTAKVSMRPLGVTKGAHLVLATQTKSVYHGKKFIFVTLPARQGRICQKNAVVCSRENDSTLHPATELKQCTRTQPTNFYITAECC